MPSISDYKIYGQEPTWDAFTFSNEIERRTAIGKAFNWYNYMSESSDHKKWLIEYLSKFEFSEQVIDNISKLSVDDINLSYNDIPGREGFKTGVLARLMVLGAPLDQRDVESMQTAVQLLDVRGSRINTNTPQRPSVQKHIDDNFCKILEFFDTKCDKILQAKPLPLGITQRSIDDSIRSIGKSKNTNTTDDVKNYIDNIKAIYCKKIIDYYTPVYSEICEVVHGDDDQLKEGYAAYSKTTLNNFKNLVDKIINDCKNRIDTAPKPIVIRRKRRKPVNEVVKKLKYKKDDAAAAIVSILPSKIVEAQKLVVYNSKTRTVTIYEAVNSQGLSVKGTTIINFDEKKSRTKKLRKPKEFFTKVRDKGIRAFKSAFDAVKSVEKPAKGRINSDIVLYGVFE